MIDSKVRAANAQQFNQMLRGELTAVATYSQVLDKAAEDLPEETERLLRAERASHAERVKLLRDEIQALGEVPVLKAGIWGALARLIEGGAEIVGTDAMIAALEHGEKLGVRSYEKKLGRLSEAAESLVRKELLPRQKMSCEAIGEAAD